MVSRVSDGARGKGVLLVSGLPMPGLVPRPVADSAAGRRGVSADRVRALWSARVACPVAHGEVAGVLTDNVSILEGRPFYIDSDHIESVHIESVALESRRASGVAHESSDSGTSERSFHIVLARGFAGDSVMGRRGVVRAPSVVL